MTLPASSAFSSDCSPAVASSARRGAFVVFEGCDRSGKSTQCRLLVDKLNSMNIPARLYRFPDRSTPIGKSIDAYLKQISDIDDHAIHLLFSANRWESMAALKQDLLNGVTVIVDRYAYSGVAFSTAKGLDRNWCKSCDVGLLKPDLVLFLDLNMEEMSKRGGFGEERYENMEFQQKVRSCFEEWINQDEIWELIDASVSVEELHDILHKRVMELLSTLKESKNPPLSNSLFQ